MFYVIKDIDGKHKHGPVVSKRFTVNYTEIDDFWLISNRFNECFVNIGNNLADEIKMQPNSYEQYLGGTFQESMFLSSVTKEEMNSIISTFGDTNGCDDIASRSITLVNNTLRPRQNGRHFADENFLNEKAYMSIKISLKFVPKGPINNIPALV